MDRVEVNPTETSGLLGVFGRFDAVRPADVHRGSAEVGGDHTVEVWGRDISAGGDIIVAVEGVYLTDMSDLLTTLITNYAPGDTISLTVIRGGETVEVPVTLASRPTSGGQAVSECEQRSE